MFRRPDPDSQLASDAYRAILEELRLIDRSVLDDTSELAGRAYTLKTQLWDWTVLSPDTQVKGLREVVENHYSLILSLQAESRLTVRVFECYTFEELKNLAKEYTKRIIDYRGGLGWFPTPGEKPYLSPDLAARTRARDLMRMLKSGKGLKALREAKGRLEEIHRETELQRAHLDHYQSEFERLQRPALTA